MKTEAVANLSVNGFGRSGRNQDRYEKSDDHTMDAPGSGVANSELAKPRPSAPTVPASCALSFSVLQRSQKLDWSEDESLVTVNAKFVQAALELLADRVFVDEAWYRQTYPDIAAAIDNGKFKDAKHHYIKFGYFEDRMPHFIRVDEAFYAANNGDISAGVQAGRIPSCQGHFEQYGLKEGRLPYEGWKLITDS